jgi:DNA-binding transcriptional LysR family regulator
MELRDLEYFVVVAQHGNVTRAAEALELSTPALSKCLRRLESSVAAKLVERTPRGVALTPAGKLLLAKARRLGQLKEEVVREVADLAHGQAGELRIGLSQVDGEALPAAYSHLLREAPKLILKLTVGNNDVMVPRLCAGELDLVFNIIPAAPYEGTVQEHLFDDEFVVCAAKDHPLVNRRNLRLSDLAGQRWALTAPDIASRAVLEQALRKAGLPAPYVAVEARSIRIRLQSWASAGLLGITSKRLLIQAARRFNLVQLPVKGAGWPRPVGAVYRKDGYLPPAGRRLIELLRVELNLEAGTPASRALRAFV